MPSRSRQGGVQGKCCYRFLMQASSPSPLDLGWVTRLSNKIPCCSMTAASLTCSLVSSCLSVRCRVAIASWCRRRAPGIAWGRGPGAQGGRAGRHFGDHLASEGKHQAVQVRRAGVYQGQTKALYNVHPLAVGKSGELEACRSYRRMDCRKAMSWYLLGHFWFPCYSYAS